MPHTTAGSRRLRILRTNVDSLVDPERSTSSNKAVAVGVVGQPLPNISPESIGILAGLRARQAHDR